MQQTKLTELAAFQFFVVELGHSEWLVPASLFRYSLVQRFQLLLQNAGLENEAELAILEAQGVASGRLISKLDRHFIVQLKCAFAQLRECVGILDASHLLAECHSRPLLLRQLLELNRAAQAKDKVS